MGHAREGAHTEAKVVSINDGGLLVELPMEVEAFVPASELRNGPNQFDQYYNPGDKLDLQVIKFDPSNKEIVLSETAKQRAEEQASRSMEDREKREMRERERREVAEYQGQQAASGPTTLGELSGLAALKSQIEEAERAADSATAESDSAESETEATEVEGSTEVADEPDVTASAETDETESEDESVNVAADSNEEQAETSEEEASDDESEEDKAS